MKASAKLRSGAMSRRDFLRGLSFAPSFLRSAPLLGSFLHLRPGGPVDYSLADVHFSPHYPAQSPLTDIFKLVPPGSDGYPLERYAVEIESILNDWGAAVTRSLEGIAGMNAFVAAQIDVSGIEQAKSEPVRSRLGIETSRRSFAPVSELTREKFIETMRGWLSPASHLQTAEFEIYGIELAALSPQAVRAEIRYDVVLVAPGGKREERVGSWHTEWSRDDAQSWRATEWRFGEEKSATAEGPGFVDVTSQVFGAIDSYHSQLLHGADYWRTVIDAAVGLDVYGNNGVAAGDFDGDGFDDLYVCQAAGLPNRLYRNQGDGTFEDVTEKAGVGVLDRTSCALFADFLNRGRQDLLVVCGTGPLLFLNNGNGTFTLKRDAFQFARAPQGTFTHAAITDYDNDGRLDVYFCVYMYYLGLDQYNYPVPYYDARNGPPNHLFHNQGDGTFVEATDAAGLNKNNDRYSFACAWGDSNGNGLPDLFVANDFGSSQLYRNKGDGTFEDVSTEAHIESVGAGMGCCWADFDNDGRQDIYVPSMWEAAGQRVSQQPQFHPNAPDRIRELYRRHAKGNALYRNQKDGTFKNIGPQAAVEMGRWSWAADFWDWDHDGYCDLLVCNGYLTGPEEDELAGFFWRQVVAKSPDDTTPLTGYERGWNAINELVRADHTWHGLARNVAFANNRDGTFTEASGTLQLDFRDDARAFALADLDHDGRLEVILKSRNAPQVRVLHNELGNIGNSISFCLRGTRSNRDGIGASVTISVGGITQTKYLQAGSGFLSQHAKELFFGLGSHQGAVEAIVRWPSGLKQTVPGISAGHRIEIEEGNSAVRATPFTTHRKTQETSVPLPLREPLPTRAGTWLIQPIKAPAFKLRDVSGVEQSLDAWKGRPVLLTFWSTEGDGASSQLAELKARAALLRRAGITVAAINLDGASGVSKARQVAAQYQACASMLFATDEVSGIYNLLYRHLLDRHRDLPIPASMLIDGEGMIVKLYQGLADAAMIAEDSKSIPTENASRMRAALPFSGMLMQDAFHRNDFSYGVALYQHGFLEQAAESFEQVIASKPDNANAYYNLGTLNLRRNHPEDAKAYLQKTIELRPDFAEAWNNLGMLAAQQGNGGEAIQDFEESIRIRPTYHTAFLNLGNVCRQQGDFDKAEASLSRAFSIRPDDPEVLYSLGMLSIHKNEFDRAADYLERAISIRPEYPEALNNLGVLYARRGDNARAEGEFLAGIKVAPSFDQSYLNLARLYVGENESQKAREILQKLLQVQPDNANASRALRVLQSQP